MHAQQCLTHGTHRLIKMLMPFGTGIIVRLRRLMAEEKTGQADQPSFFRIAPC
jgi:hypothetical protein